MTTGKDAAYKRDIKEYQCLLILKAYLDVSEQKESKKIDNFPRMLESFEVLVAAETALSEDKKDDVLIGNDQKLLDGKALWTRANAYKKRSLAPS